ncbi:hypothetical protein DF3PB_710005 [uncultured Defluviicoccus sp.]|uniref:Lipoprotein n=1 Tax=metagenome TaxID=256318 RepID=A0A380TLB2_9ZZZZ|nr:hypothetical protein DF3PB_710005 [uncultured Defluviicoccus sp.]
MPALRVVLVSLAALGIGGCAASYLRARTVDFVADGNAAVAASRAYYSEIVAQQHGLIKLLYRNNPECPLASSIVIRRNVSDALLETIEPECRQVFKAENAKNALCLSEAAIECRNEIAPEGESGSADLRAGLGSEFATRPLDVDYFADSMALIAITTEYLDLLAKHAQEPQNAKTFAARVTQLVPRINSIACQLADPATDCTSENAPEVLGESQAAALKAAAALADLIRQLADDARAARDIRGTLDTKGKAFDDALSLLILDVEAKRKAYLANFSMERVDLLSDYWQKQAASLSEDRREAVVVQWIGARQGLEVYFNSPASPVKLLTEVQIGHQDLQRIFRGKYNDAERAELAAIRAQQLGDAFRLTFGFVRALGLI